MERTISLLKSLMLPRTSRGGMKSGKLFMMPAVLALAIMLGQGTAWAGAECVNVAISFSPGTSVPEGTAVTITGTVTAEGKHKVTGQCSSANYAPHTRSAGTAISGVTVQIQALQDDTTSEGVTCGTANATFTTIGSGSTNGAGQFSITFPTVSLAGSTICFLAHSLPSPSGVASPHQNTEEDKSSEQDLTILDNGVGMPVSKTINGTTATCEDGPDLRAPENGGTGNPDESRKCSFLQITPILDLFNDDPRFDINAYETVDGLPGKALDPITKEFTGPDFPAPGPRIPPVFHPSLPAGTELTICERLTYPAPYTNIYTLSTATTTPTTQEGVPTGPSTNVPIYFQNGGDGNRYACFNIVMPVDGTPEFAINLDNTEVCTYTQGAYGNLRSGGGRKLNADFGGLYPNGLRVGDQSGVAGFNPGNIPPDGWGVLFTSAAGVEGFLPAGGPAAALNNDYTNPPKTSPPADVTGSGVFGGQVTTLQLNVDLGGIGNYLIFKPGQCGNELKVSDVLADANKALSGLGSTCTIGELNSLADELTQSFHECVANPWIFTPPDPAVQ